MAAQAKASLEAIGGYDVETGNKPLDPLNLAKYIPAETLRKYETVHCRVAMLACVGYAFPREFLESRTRNEREGLAFAGGKKKGEGGARLEERPAALFWARWPNVFSRRFRWQTTRVPACVVQRGGVCPPCLISTRVVYTRKFSSSIWYSNSKLPHVACFAVQCVSFRREPRYNHITWCSYLHTYVVCGSEGEMLEIYFRTCAKNRLRRFRRE